MGSKIEQFFRWFDGLLSPPTRGGLAMIGAWTIVLAVCYALGKRAMAKELAVQRQPGDTEDYPVTMTVESWSPMKESASKYIKVVNVVKEIKLPKGEAPSNFEEVLRFPSYKHRLELMKSGEYQALVNTRWIEMEWFPFDPGTRLDFYGDHLGRLEQRGDCYWFLWRLVNASTLQTRMLVEFGNQYGNAPEPWWCLDPSDSTGPEEWETHQIRFEETNIDTRDAPSVILLGFGAEPLRCS